MGWRTVVINQTCKLDYKMGYLCVRNKDEIRRVFIDEINCLIIENPAVALTSYLLVALANAKVNIIFCDEKRLPQGEYHVFYGSHDASRKVRNQIKWTVEQKSNIWQKIVYRKINGQSAVLAFNGLAGASAKLQTYLPEIVPGDKTNREGHAAKVYFNALMGNEFTREDDADVINAALNYGYAVLLASVSREIVSNGYITQIGIFHDNVFNELNLASDLMEPFRPFIDQTVVSMKLEELGHEEKMHIVKFLESKVIIEGKEQFLSNALKIYIKSVLDAIDKNLPELIKFPDYELSIYESNSFFRSTNIDAS